MNVKRRNRLFILLGIVILVVAGALFRLNADRLKPINTAAIGGSNLLGVSLSALEKQFGKPSSTIQAMKSGTGMYLFKQGQVMVSFLESRSYQVNYTLAKGGTDLQSAKALALRMMPQDSRIVRTRKGISQQVVDVYQSGALSGQFGQTVFSDTSGNLHPGIFDVSYVTGRGSKVTEVDFAVGDNS